MVCMRSDIYVHIPDVTITVQVQGMDGSGDATIRATLARIESALGIIRQQETQMAMDLSTLQAAVEADTTVDQSAITLLNTLAAELSAAAADPAAVQAIADQLTANSASLAAAVAANTPAAPPTV